MHIQHFLLYNYIIGKIFYDLIVFVKFFNYFFVIRFYFIHIRKDLIIKDNEVSFFMEIYFVRKHINLYEIPFIHAF